jgi:hypothetical protein
MFRRFGLYHCATMKSRKNWRNIEKSVLQKKDLEIERKTDPSKENQNGNVKEQKG